MQTPLLSERFRGRLARHLWLPALLFLIVGIGLLVSYHFRARMVRDIVVLGNRYMPVPEILRLSGLVTGRKYANEEIQKAEDILELHPFIKEAHIERERLLAGERLRIIIEERSCSALVQNTKEPDIIYEVDSELEILSENHVRCKGVPLLRGQFQKETDRFSDPVLKDMVLVVQDIRALYPQLATRISEVRVRREGGLQLFLTGRAVRIEVPGRLGRREIRQLYATVFWLEQNRLKKGLVYLRENESIVIPGSRLP